MPAEHDAAVRTLTRLGYTYHGGEEWKPPLGPAPRFDRIDLAAMRAAAEKST